MVATAEEGGGGGGGGRGASRRKSGKPERYKNEDGDGDGDADTAGAAKRSPPKSAAAVAASPAASSAKKKTPASKIKIESGGGGGIKIGEGEKGEEEEEETATAPQPQRTSGRIRIKLRGAGNDDGPARGVGGGDIPPTNVVKLEGLSSTRSGKRGREGGVVAAPTNGAAADDEDEDDEDEDDDDGGDDGALSRKPTAANKTVKVRVRLHGDVIPPPQCPAPDGTLYAELVDAAVVPWAAVRSGNVRDDDDVDGTGAGDIAEAAGGGGRGGGERTIEEGGGEEEESPPVVVEGLDGAREAADGAVPSLSAVAAKAEEEEEEEEEEDLARDGAAAPLPQSSSSEQLLQPKSLSRGKYCAYESCTRYRQTGCYGYCLTHRHHSDPALHAHRREVANAQSCEKKRTMKNRSNLCKWPDCLKYIQSNCHGYCLTHVKYADYMGSSGGGGGEGEFGGGMMGGGAEDTADYDDDLLYEVTKVRVRVQQRLQNGFCRAILPMELRDKWGFVRGGGEEEEEEEEDYGVNPGMPGREDDHDEYSEDDGRRGTMFLGEADERGGNVDENDDDDEPAFAAADATAAALPRMDGDLHDENGEIDAPQRIDGEDAEPGFRAADANDAAAARSSGKKFSDDMLDFPVSSTPVKKFNGSLKCRAVSCPKNCQGNSDGFCRAHHNQYLICTGQCDSWVCICGNKIVDFMARCGACHRWRGGKHPLSSSLPAAKRLKNNAGAAVEMAGDQAGTVDDVGGIRSSLTYVPPDAAAQISEKQLTNGSGRALCKVIGCGKLDQSNNDGFCRTHFNMFAVEGADSDLDGWTCVCGQSMSGKQKRCGSCNKWRGGKRDAYETNKGNGFSEESIIYDDNDGEPWTCDCGNVVPAAKSRCGGCHHWRGGKRQGGWKLGSIGRDYDSDDGVDRTLEWTCCGTTIPAQQTRCGKCNGWRGGKRIAGGASAGLTIASNLPPWVCIKCHISNPGNKRRCGGCLVWKTTVQSSKSSKPSKPRASFGDAIFMGEGGSTSGGHWQCKKCNFDNFASELECFVCQSMRPNYQWHKKQQIINSSTTVPTTQHGTAMTAVVTVTPQPSLPAAYAVLAEGTATSSQLTPPGLAAGGKPTLPVAAQGATSNIGSGKNQLTSTNLVAASMNKQGAATAPTPGNSGNVVADSISRPPDDLNYYGTYNEDLGYPYISIHYDFNRAYYHNHDYTYLNASAARSSCGNSNSHGGDCK